MQCSLPKVFRSLCRTGCIYREEAFKHLKCPKTKKTDICAAPCEKPCDCSASRDLTKTNDYYPKNLQPCLQ